MPTFSKHPFSGSALGLPVDIGATGSPGTTIHTVGPTATDGTEFDSIYLYVANALTVGQVVTIEFGGTATANQIKMNIASQDGPNLVIPGWPLIATDSIIRAFCATATAGLRIAGYANRATATTAA